MSNTDIFVLAFCIVTIPFYIFAITILVKQTKKNPAWGGLLIYIGGISFVGLIFSIFAIATILMTGKWAE